MKKPKLSTHRFSPEFEIALEALKHAQCVHSISDQKLEERIKANQSVVRPEAASTKLH